MKKRLSLALLFILTLCLCVVGCNKTPLSMPNGKVASGSGTSVAKIGKTEGSDNFVYYDYLYFANAYKDSTITESELSSDQSIYSVNRIKTAKNGDLVDIDNETVGTIENISEKVAGYKNSMMFAVGDYLYFNSPNLHKNSKTNQYEFDLICLFKIKLDGTGLEEIYKSETTSPKFYLTGGESKMLLIYDDNVLKTYNFESGKLNTISKIEDSTSLVLPSKFGEEIDTVYFTKAREDEITGNILYKASLNDNNAPQIVEQENYQTVTLLSYNNGVLLYSVANSNSTTTIKAIKNGLKTTLLSYETDTSSDYSNFLYAKGNNGIDEYLIFTANSKLYVTSLYQNPSSQNVVADEEVTVRFVDKGKIIYTTSNGIFVYDLYLKSTNQISDRTDMADVFDYDGQYVYFYSELDISGDDKGTETKYLHRASIINTEDNMEIECVSKLADTDKKLIEE